jgi:hypothetical protein
LKNKYLILLVLFAVMMAVGCTGSSNEKTNQPVENSSPVKENPSESTATAAN